MKTTGTHAFVGSGLQGLVHPISYLFKHRQTLHFRLEFTFVKCLGQSPRVAPDLSQIVYLSAYWPRRVQLVGRKPGRCHLLPGWQYLRPSLAPEPLTLFLLSSHSLSTSMCSSIVNYCQLQQAVWLQGIPLEPLCICLSKAAGVLQLPKAAEDWGTWETPTCPCRWKILSITRGWA